MKNKKTKKQRSKKPATNCSVGCDKPAVAKGLCDRCYRRFRKFGTTETLKIDDLPGEKWREITACPDWYVSNMGRVKSCRLKTREQLVKIKFTKADGHHRCLNFRDRNAKGRTFRLHIEVLKAFVPNEHGDTRAFFKDGDIQNCKAENLEWYGEDCLVPQAIKNAKESTSDYASSFVSFWQGDSSSLDWLWDEARQRMKSFLIGRVDMVGKNYMDVDNIAQEALVLGFIGIKRGLLKDINKVYSWFLSIARRVLSGEFRMYSKLPCVSLYHSREDDDGGWNLADITMYANPSAEITAIYNEEFM